MSDTALLVDRNHRTSGAFTHGDLPIKPRLSTFVLTCVDARVDPAHIFALEPGDAIVMRNTGGRVTPGVLRDLAVLGFLASSVPGAESLRPELVVMHHTDCGMSRLADPAAQRVLGERLGITPQEVEAMAITDPSQSVRDDIERLRQTPGVPGTLIVSGLVYDVTSGTVAEVVAPSPVAG